MNKRCPLMYQNRVGKKFDEDAHEMASKKHKKHKKDKERPAGNT